jgi:tRNA threonylcarbamoyladenosine biosynthesis protein TsaE
MRTHSAGETRQLGERLAAQLKAGDTLLLRGELGSGKSELTRGLAKGLGVTETVASPSFTILNVYESGRLPLYHFDWYRLESAEELYELGMDEYLGGDGIAAVEWPEQCEDAVPEKALEIRFSYVDENTRDLVFRRLGGFHEIDGVEET